jgi:hypothetical protein
MPTNVLAATGVVANGQQGLLATLPKDGNTYTGHDPNNNTCRVWRDAATGMLQKDVNLNVVWWSYP